MARVDLEGVSRVFPGGVVAVDNLNLTVKDQELLVLVGPSGCGKSTTLRMIAGLEEVTAGEIRIGGRSVNDTPPKDRDIAMVFQNYALYPHMTVYKNMAFGLQLRYGVSWFKQALYRIARPAEAARLAQRRLEIDERVRQAAATLGIEKLLERMPRQLSGGEQQRVALGRAIVRQPAAFLFDEPLSNLDAKLRAETRRELKQLHGRLKATMIYVTHDQVEALTLGDRVVVMDRGAIQQVGAPREVYEQPRNMFVAAFIGAPPMNLIEGELTRQPDGKMRFQADAWSITLAKGKYPSSGRQPRRLQLGIRAEDVCLRSARPEMSSAESIAAKVRLVEPLGDAVVAHLELGAKTEKGRDVPWVLAKLDARCPIAVGDNVEVVLDIARMHLFDPQSGDNLSLGAAESTT